MKIEIKLTNLSKGERIQEKFVRLDNGYRLTIGEAKQYIFNVKPTEKWYDIFKSKSAQKTFEYVINNLSAFKNSEYNNVFA